MPRKAATQKARASSRGADNEPAASAAVRIDPTSNDLTLNPSDILDETISVTLPKGARCRNLRLVPSPSLAPFIGSITPPGGYGPITGEQEQTFRFRVQFHGIPCAREPQVVTGTIDAVCNDRPVARKEVRITVPACPPSEFVYSAKFICGVQPACGCECTSVQPGRYATEITIHNFGLRDVVLQKRFIPVVLAGAPVGREPKAAPPRAEDRIVLPPQTATMDDCCRITELLFAGDTGSAPPITIGFLEITASGPIAVSAFYSTAGLDCAGVSIEVEQIPPRHT